MSLLSWIESLLKDKDAGAAFLSSPVAVMESAGYSPHCGEDVKDAALALVDSKHIAANDDSPSAIAIAVSDGEGSGAEYIKHIVKNYHYKDEHSEHMVSNSWESNSWDNDTFSFDIDDRDTSVDASVDNSFTQGDVTLGEGAMLDQDLTTTTTTTTTTASGDRAVAAGDDLDSVATGDGNQVASRGGDNDSETNTAGDDVVTRGGSNDESDNSINDSFQAEDSFNDNREDNREDNRVDNSLDQSQDNDLTQGDGINVGANDVLDLDALNTNEAGPGDADGGLPVDVDIDALDPVLG